MSRPLLRHPLAAPLRHPLAAPGAPGPAIAQIAITQGVQPGATLSVTVADAGRDTDPATIQQLAATVVNQRTGESETLTLAETSAGSGVFAGGLATLRAAAVGSDDDGTMNAVAGDVLVASYDQPEPAGTRTAQTTLQGTVATVTMTATPAPGDTLDLTVADPDADTDPATPQQVAVTVSNATTGESETVTLTETGNATGVFAGTLATTDATGAGSDDDGTLNVQGGDVLTASYADTAPAGVRTAEVAILGVPDLYFLESSNLGGNGKAIYSLALSESCKTLIAIIMLSENSAYSLDTVTYNGVLMVEAAKASLFDADGNLTVGIYCLQSPETGSSLDFVADWSGAGFLDGAAAFFYEVDALVAVGATGTSTSGDGGTTSLLVSIGTTVANSFILTGLAIEEGLDSASVLTEGVVYEHQNALNPGIRALGASSAYSNDAGGVGLKGVEWTWVVGGGHNNDSAVSVAVEFVPQH